MYSLCFTLKLFTFGALTIRSHSAARVNTFLSAVRWLLIDFFDWPSVSFFALNTSISAGPISLSFIEPKNGDRCSFHIHFFA